MNEVDKMLLDFDIKLSSENHHLYMRDLDRIRRRFERTKTKELVPLSEPASNFYQFFKSEIFFFLCVGSDENVFKDVVAKFARLFEEYRVKNFAGDYKDLPSYPEFKELSDSVREDYKKHPEKYDVPFDPIGS